MGQNSKHLNVSDDFCRGGGDLPVNIRYGGHALVENAALILKNLVIHPLVNRQHKPWVPRIDHTSMRLRRAPKKGLFCDTALGYPSCKDRAGFK